MHVCAIVLALALAACSGDDVPTDAGRTDGPRVDGNGTDAGTLPDGAGTDAPGTDAPGADGGEPARTRLVYVTVGGESRLAVIELAADGTMSVRDDLGIALPGNPGPMAFARNTRRLYIGVQPGSIATVTLDGSGAPSLDGATDAMGFPVYVEVAHDDSVIVTAYFGGDRLRTWDAAGAPPHAMLDDVATDDEPHQAIVGPTGDRLYVPHRNGNTTHWYDLAADGTLTFEDELAAEPGVGPRHISFSPDGAYAYLIYEYADAIATHTVGADGSLTRTDTQTTLPAGFDGDMNTCADVHVGGPGGAFVYGSNRGHDSLAMFSRDGSGALTALGQVSTEARPREFDVSPDGRFVIAAGQDSGQLQSYRIEADGTLTMVDRLAVGDELLWAIIE